MRTLIDIALLATAVSSLLIVTLVAVAPTWAACTTDFDTVTVGNGTGPGVTIVTCKDDGANTFTVKLPIVTVPESDTYCCPDGEFGFEDEITVPNDRPIYALLVSGFNSNQKLDRLYFYNFAYDLMARDGYVHWSWWNNMLRPYMAGPLHYASLAESHPGDLEEPLFQPAEQCVGWKDPPDQKAIPREDYQFQADALRYLAAIRYHNPSAQIILVGHSMGGAAVARLGTKADEAGIVIDLLAPIDPVGNRSTPGGLVSSTGWCWSRSRVAFLWDHGDGYVHLNPNNDPIPRRQYSRNIINLYHRWQHEFTPPSDYPHELKFVPETKAERTSPEPANTYWRQDKVDHQSCVPDGGTHDPGTCFPYEPDNRFPDPKPPIAHGDGHGEIVGHFGLTVGVGGLFTFTIFEIGITPKGSWSSARDRELNLHGRDGMEESALAGKEWDLQPTFRGYSPVGDYGDVPSGKLCMVSGVPTDPENEDFLIGVARNMNCPPMAVADASDLIDIVSSVDTTVTLDGSGSSDPHDGDDDIQAYKWEVHGEGMKDPFDSATGIKPEVTLPVGRSVVTLTVTDKARHIAKDRVEVIVAPALELAIGVLQNPYLTQYVDVFVTASDTLKPSSVEFDAAGTRVPMEMEDPEDNLWTADYKLSGSGVAQFDVCAESYLGRRECASTSIAAFSVTAGGATTIESADKRFRARMDVGIVRDNGFVVVTSSPSTPSFETQKSTDEYPVLVSYHVGPATLYAGGTFSIEFDYADLDLPAGAAKSQLVIKTGGENLPSVIDLENGVVRANANHWGEYRLVLGSHGVSPIADPSFVRLDPNYPNPFNPTTTIQFEVQTSQHVRLVIYDVTGRPVRTLVDRKVPAGIQRIRWDGRSNTGGEVSSGVYFSNIRTSSRRETRKMVLIR